MAQADIDVVIPVYNGAKTLESAIGSIQAQTFRNIRIIAVNDGSTDDSLAKLERMAGEDGRITVLNQPNGGIVDALNAGLAVAEADIVARHDADDLALPDRFERQFQYLRDHPRCNAVSGAIMLMNERGRTYGGLSGLCDPDEADPFYYPQIEPYLVHPFLMVRRAAVAAVGGYRHVYHAEDTDLYWRLQEIGQIANMPSLMGYYRVHNQSVTGASTLNGRIAAMSSQRCGLAAIRRRAGRPDLSFPREAVSEYKAAGSLDEIVRLGSRGLDVEEAAQLATATACKLLELASYRPYELTQADCIYIRRVITEALPGMTPINRATAIRQLSGTAARLSAKGHVASAFRLCPPRYYPQAALRLGFRFALPPPARHFFRGLAARASSAN